MTMIRKPSNMGFFPLADHAIHGNPYAQNIIGKENPLQNHTLTAISYTNFMSVYSCIFLLFASLMRKVCFLFEKHTSNTPQTHLFCVWCA